MENIGISDGDVMGQVRGGRLERLAILFERHHVHLFNFFLRLQGHRAASEDLVQEVFLRMLRYRTSYRPDSPFAPWMWQIARNVLRDHYQGQPGLQSLDEVLDVMADPRTSAETHCIQAQDADRLDQALAQLSPAKRELLLLSRNPDLAYADLASLLACSVGAVKVQVHRALKELKTAFFSLNGGLP